MPKPSKQQNRQIRVEALTRVEGEGGLYLSMRNGKVEKCEFRIWEPPRFYEAFLRGRELQAVPDITARICGICPVAYQMSSCHALEKALGADGDITDDIRRMRNLFYCGEWVESHLLHMFMLHLPDFLGYESAIEMANERGDLLRRAMKVRKAGNHIVELMGGRSVHPVGTCVGGFYSFPAPYRWREYLPEIKAALEEMCDLTEFLATEIEYPDFEQDYEFIALQSENEYPMNLGRIVSSKGLNVEPNEYLDVVEERQVAHSTALQTAVRQRGPLFAGPLARLNINADKLHPRAAELLPTVCDSSGHELPWRNSYLSLPARALESVHALALAVEIIKDCPQGPSRIPLSPRRGTGAHATEAPRGLLWHRYEVNDEGLIESARIIPPTSQNQAQIETDLRKLAESHCELGEQELRLRCEQMIRNFDPCISCATH